MKTLLLFACLTLQAQSLLPIAPTPSIIDTRFTNWFGSVTFAWNENTEPDLAGYRIYYGPASRLYTNFVSTGLTNQVTLTLSRTNRHYFNITAVNTNGVEGLFSATELTWPNPPMPYYTNWVVSVPYGVSASLDGPLTVFTARLHYISQTNGSVFWRTLPLKIERAP